MEDGLIWLTVSELWVYGTGIGMAKQNESHHISGEAEERGACAECFLWFSSTLSEPPSLCAGEAHIQGRSPPNVLVHKLDEYGFLTLGFLFQPRQTRFTIPVTL